MIPKLCFYYTLIFLLVSSAMLLAACTPLAEQVIEPSTDSVDINPKDNVSPELHYPPAKDLTAYYGYIDPGDNGKWVSQVPPAKENPVNTEKPAVNPKKPSAENPPHPLDAHFKLYEDKYGNLKPQKWGENVTGVITKINTNEKIIALTFDACGSSNDGYDRKIIEFLIKEDIPATLFISGRWIERHLDIFADLAENQLFEIANHGYSHKPLSVNGKSAYGIPGTKSIREVVEEILLNENRILELTGQKPRYFRSGTAYYDDVAVKIANDLGYQVINYNVLGDAGATFSTAQIIRACGSATPGSIILFHMNRPERGISTGIIQGITQLQNDGFRFVKLSEYHDQLNARK